MMDPPLVPHDRRQRSHRDDGSSPNFDTKGTLLQSSTTFSSRVSTMDQGSHNGIEKFPEVETYYLGAGTWGPGQELSGSRQHIGLDLSAARAADTSLYAGSLAPRSTVERRRDAALDYGQRHRSDDHAVDGGLVSGSTCENDKRAEASSSRPRSRPPPFAAPYAI